MYKKIKWCAIQPLTGGMYIGAENIIGHPAEFILSYPGFGDPIYDCDNNLIKCGNEYHLMQYLELHNRRPEYKVFNRKPFQNDNDMNPEILNHNLWTINPDKQLNYSDIDLCVAVPVCSGLSTVSTGSQDARNEKNCNMIWISKYVLNVIKPNIYIFENAPTFMGVRGEGIRHILEYEASQNGYSIIYYKTDTKYHDNCQTRKRTFIIFMKKDFSPAFDFESNETCNEEYFNRIPDNLKYDYTELDIKNVNCVNYFLIEYLKSKFGSTWRETINNDVFKYIIDNNLWDDVKQFTIDISKNDSNERYQKYMLHFIEHFNFKRSQGKGVFHALPNLLKKDGYCPAVMFKMVQSCLHYNEDRLLNIRELLHLMGLPHDFELYGNPYYGYNQIGQNVPVKTAMFIIKQALDAFNKTNDLDDIKKIRYFNNINKSEIKY